MLLGPFCFRVVSLKGYVRRGANWGQDRSTKFGGFRFQVPKGNANRNAGFHFAINSDGFRADKGWHGSGFSFWESGATAPTFTIPVGAISANSYNITQTDGSPGADPFGHIHGRRLTASRPGIYLVTFQAYDTCTNGAGGGPIHQPPSPRATVGTDEPAKPFTLVIQIDAWNIRERDHWGQTQKRRRRNQEVDRWHWVYTATCFRLDHRCVKGRFKTKGRAIITKRNYVATRGGVEDLMQQLYYEARASGLAQAQRVLVIADGAVWIWNLVEDRFQEAVQRLDLYHANTYLWAVANELHGNGTPESRQWVKPLLKQIRNDQVAQVITQLEALKPRLTQAAAKAAGKAIEYYQNDQKRMKYKQGRKLKEPVGSGAIESTCRQLQCRMKRCGQFWSTQGDEALLCLEMFWRNQRWEMLFPHAALTAIAKN